MAKRLTQFRTDEVQRAVASAQPDQAADTQSLSMGSEPSEEDIRLRAYQKFLERGGGDGRDLDDWVGAEQELRMK